MSVADETDHPAGYKRPPVATRFVKGRSDNPQGRPRNRHREIPYDIVLGRMVTIREEGRERRVTAAEAFILQLTPRGLQGDSAAARASLAPLETARASRGSTDGGEVLRVVIVAYGVGRAQGAWDGRQAQPAQQGTGSLGTAAVDRAGGARSA